MFLPFITVAPGHAKTVQPLQLRAVDVASDFVFYGTKPRLEDADGKRKNLNKADMMEFICYLLFMVGFHKDGCLLVGEGGAFHIMPDAVRLIGALNGGKVQIRQGGVDRVTPAGQWGYDRKGNPDAKPHVEGSHNLAQNRLDYLPGYMGGNSRLNKPEELEALKRDVEKILEARGAMTSGEAEQLCFPVKTWEEMENEVAVAYDAILDTRDHALEGWDACYISTRLNDAEIGARITRTISGNMLLIVDELHRPFITSTPRTALRIVEWLRELYDKTQCGMVFSSTRVGKEELENGPNAMALEQFRRRGIIQLELPATPPKSDINKFAKAFGLPPPEGAAVDIINTMLQRSGLKQYVVFLQSAGNLAANPKKNPRPWWTPAGVPSRSSTSRSSTATASRAASWRATKRRKPTSPASRPKPSPTSPPCARTAKRETSSS